MKYKPKIIFIVGVFVILLVSSGILTNYKMNQFQDSSGSPLPGKARYTVANSQTTFSAATQGKSRIVKGNERLPSKSGSQSAANQSKLPLESSSSGKDIKVSDLEKRIGQPVAKQDIVKAGLILMSKLSTKDIRYLKNVVMQNSCSRQEYLQSQKILLSRLSAEDINTLNKLGEKYGIETKILSSSTKQ